MPKNDCGITLQWRPFAALSAETLYDLLRFRQQIFVVEQRSPYPDLDGLDAMAQHLLLREERALSGYLRLLPPSSPATAVRIGRVAVAVDGRRRGLGRRLMTEALAFCRDHHRGRIVTLSAQLYLVRFYESFGFVPASAPFDDFGVAHVEMTLPGNPAAPTFTS